MKRLLAVLALTISVCSCQSDNHSAKTIKQKLVPPPPPPPPRIGELPDAIDKIEEAKFYSGFELARAFDKKQKDSAEKWCGYKFNSFFYDEDKLAAIKNASVMLFEYSLFNNPMYFEKGRLADKWVDDEWQEIVFFQLPPQSHFRLVDKELLKIKLCAVTSTSGVLESGDGRYFIKHGFLEGNRVNDSVYNVRVEARYQAVMPDTSYWVPVWIDANFKRQNKFSEPWEYKCPLFKEIAE